MWLSVPFIAGTLAAILLESRLDADYDCKLMFSLVSSPRTARHAASAATWGRMSDVP